LSSMLEKARLSATVPAPRRRELDIHEQTVGSVLNHVQGFASGPAPFPVARRGSCPGGRCLADPRGWTAERQAAPHRKAS